MTNANTDTVTVQSEDDSISVITNSYTVEVFCDGYLQFFGGPFTGKVIELSAAKVIELVLTSTLDKPSTAPVI